MPDRPRAYHHLWLAPRWRWWRSLLVLGVGAAIFFALQVAAIAIAGAIDISTGRQEWSSLGKGEIQVTPAIFIANNISLVLLVLVAPLLAWLFTGQRPGWLASVVGRVRWGWLGRCMAMIAPLWIVLTALQYWASRGDPDSQVRWSGDSLILIVAIILTTPLQSAGEEFAFRGLVNRGVASWFPQERVGLVMGGLASSGLFMWAHSAQDPWLNLFYFSFGMVGAWLAFRTGGLEASIAIHVVNNVTSEWSLPFTDISGMFDRQDGSGGPQVLIFMVVPLIALGLIEWQARRHHVINRYQPVPSGTAALAAPPGPTPWSGSLSGGSVTGEPWLPPAPQSAPSSGQQPGPSSGQQPGPSPAPVPPSMPPAGQPPYPPAAPQAGQAPYPPAAPQAGQPPYPSAPPAGQPPYPHAGPQAGQPLYPPAASPAGWPGDPWAGLGSPNAAGWAYPPGQEPGSEPGSDKVEP